MKRLFLLTLPLIVLSLYGAGCDAFKPDETAPTGGVVTLIGQVLNDQTNNPVPGAFVTVKPQNLLVEADEEGRYRIDVEIDSTMDVQVFAEKEGFAETSVTVLALAGREVDVPTLRIVQLLADEPISGLASNILLLQQSTSSIGVKESGSQEVAKITFQVADSLGRPVILDNTTLVHFSLGVQPGGGEFIFPENAPTDNNGLVTVNLSSGTKAGIVQIVAEADVDGRTIRSLPVAVSIHGGLPDQDHFSIGPAKFNFPGLNTFGLTNTISVIVGDKYSNPVKPGTSVSFSTTHGVIEGAAQTDDTGRGSVALISANPVPPDGIALITATTADENQQDVVGQTPVIFSGVPVITVTPTVAQLDQTYSLTVTDPNGNPLAEGTVISVKAEGTKVKAVGNTSVILDDSAFLGGNAYENVLRGPGITEFTFVAVPDLTLDEEGSPEIESVTIKVSGPNGTLEIVLTTAGEAATRTEGATIERIDRDAIRVRAPRF